MKRLLNLFKIAIGVFFTMAAFSACSSEDDNSCYFTLGIDSFSESGSSQDLVEIDAYLAKVEKAYFDAFGMTASNNSVVIDGDYKALKSQMKSKFDNVVAPAAPTISGSFSFTVELRGLDLSNASSNTSLEKMDLVASKTFSNK